jgi:rRNA maturation endonuclease Nob1
MLLPWTVHVLDSSSLIRIKHEYGPAEQWNVCDQLKGLVESGRAAFPKQVHREVARVQHPDAPGAMIDAVYQAKSVQFWEPDDETVRRVLAAAPLLHDWDARDDPADAYVVAMALELHESDDFEGVVVSADVVDREDRTSIRTACERLGLRCVSLPELLDQVAQQPTMTLAEWHDQNDPQMALDDTQDDE